MLVCIYVCVLIFLHGSGCAWVSKCVSFIYFHTFLSLFLLAPFSLLICFFVFSLLRERGQRLFLYNCSLNSNAFSLWLHPCPLPHGKHTAPSMQLPCLNYIKGNSLAGVPLVFYSGSGVFTLNQVQVDPCRQCWACWWHLFYLVATSGFAYVTQTCSFGSIPLVLFLPLIPLWVQWRCKHLLLWSCILCQLATSWSIALLKMDPIATNKIWEIIASFLQPFIFITL